MKTMTESERIRIASLVDTDGSAVLSLNSNAAAGATMLAKVLFYNNNIEIVAFFKDIVGNVGSIERTGTRYVCAAKQAINIIRQIEPHLIVKKRQAQLILSWYRRRQRRHFAPYDVKDVQYFLAVRKLQCRKGRGKRDIPWNSKLFRQLLQKTDATVEDIHEAEETIAEEAPTEEVIEVEEVSEAEEIE